MPSNLSFLKNLIEERNMTQEQIAELCEYSLDSVKSWFADPKSERWRPVPDRAITIAKLKLSSN